MDLQMAIILVQDYKFRKLLIVREHDSVIYLRAYITTYLAFIYSVQFNYLHSKNMIANDD